MLQDVDWCLSVEEKSALTEQFSLSLHLIFLLIQQLHFRCLLEFLRDLVFLGTSGGTRPNGKLLASNFLEFLDLYSIKVQAIAVLNFFIVLRRVLLTEIGEELEIDELQEGSVELQESAHHLVVYVKRQTLVKLVRSDPSDLLAHNLNLIVNSLNGEEALLETLSDGAIKHELLG